MRKDDKHEAYCGCERCKSASREMVILTPEERPLLETGGQKQKPTEGPSKPPYVEGGS